MEIIKFIISNPLYSDFLYSESAENREKASLIYHLIYKSIPFDMYCLECGSHSIFTNCGNGYSGSVHRENGLEWAPISNGEHIINFECSRNELHQFTIVIKKDGLNIKKIGQYPSIGDILTPDLKKYKPVLGASLVGEWSRAIGLCAHGIGVGSFVYLRRILESLIEAAHKEATINTLWDEQAYISSRYSEKIQMLSGYLPEFMVQNKSTYGILSKGIHELSEEQCLEYFDVLSAAIEIISEEKLMKLEIENKKLKIEKSLSSINSSIKSSS